MRAGAGSVVTLVHREEFPGHAVELSGQSRDETDIVVVIVAMRAWQQGRRHPLQSRPRSVEQRRVGCHRDDVGGLIATGDLATCAGSGADICDLDPFCTRGAVVGLKRRAALGENR